MIHVEVIPSIGLRYVLVCAAKVPLSTSRAGVIAWRGYAKHSIHGQNSAPNILPVKVAAKADLFYLDFIRSENFARSANRVIFGMIEAADKVSIEPDFWSKEWRVPYRILVARSAI